MSDELLRVLAAFACLFTMIGIFDWLRLFEKPAFYGRLIVATLAEIRAFLLLLILALITFGIPMHMLNLNRSADEDNVFIDEVSSFWGLNILLN